MTQGEDIALKSVSGGALSIEIHQWSALAYRDLLWRGAQVGDKLIVTMNIPVAGTYKYTIKPRHSVTCGAFELFANGVDMGNFDMYATKTSFVQTLAGSVVLPAGPVDLEFDLTGRNGSSSGNDFALDWALFQKV
jgi:hypothetical protein